ncbi:hypothetical protein LUZ60_013222 [Juncus effusus]|nr:hypothetical protein LUZ60_013222 [Juncus effusus]
MQLIGLILVILVRFVASNSDIDALIEFKNGIQNQNDQSASILNSWNPKTPLDSFNCPSNWHGVRCSSGRVISLYLDGLRLNGNISLNPLFKLSSLQNLSLSNNNLTGVLPPQLTKLVNLIYLNLSSNSFNGALPPNLQNLKKLQYLDLKQNGFSGKLDEILAQLQSPIYLDFSYNQFSGSLKPISDNSPIVNSIVYLNVSFNQLSGAIFGEEPVPLFDRLEVFDASFNRFSGNVPSFNFIVSLKVLRLRCNRFIGSIPEMLFKETSLVLEEIDLSGNQLTGPVRRINSLNLKYLNLSNNQLSGSLPITIGSCAIIDLSNNAITGNYSAIRTWGNYVESINLSSNQLIGTIPNETTQFLRLVSLKASNNLIEGELPEILGTYPELSTIDLSLNRLFRNLPNSLLNSDRIVNLNLSGNVLSGILPSFGNNNNITSLDLSNNSFNGEISSQIGSLSNLELLDLRMNNFTGEIGDEIGKLNNLVYLDLSSNYFTGTIPNNLPDTLSYFNVSYNNLSGKVPSNLLKFPDSSFHPGNNGLIIPNLPPNLQNLNSGKRQGHQMKRAILYTLIACGLAILFGIPIIILIHKKIIPKRGKDKNKSNKTETKPDSFHEEKSLESPEIPQIIPPSQERNIQPVSNSIQPISNPIQPFSNSIQPVSNPIQPVSNPIQPVSSYQSQNPNPITNPNSSNPSSSSIALRVYSPDKLAGDLHLFENNQINISSDELSRAPAEIIGRSCHGTLYKARLDNGSFLSVKWLKEGISKSKKEFSREVKKLGGIKHNNLVSLRGFYWGPKEHERILISDFVEAISLNAYLSEYEDRNLPPLSVPNRLELAIDIARCLDHLHNERSIPHGNLKSSNVLLVQSDPATSAFRALVTDYSLHRLMTPAGMADQVLNSSALGYSPPEFNSTSKPCPSLKSDVYAFGVILLELITGRIACEIVSAANGVVDLIDWVRLLVSENCMSECFDKRAGRGEMDEKLERMLGVAMRCVKTAAERPEIRTVFEDLEGILV